MSYGRQQESKEIEEFTLKLAQNDDWKKKWHLEVMKGNNPANVSLGTRNRAKGLYKPTEVRMDRYGEFEVVSPLI